jgi:hypothetical protein
MIASLVATAGKNLNQAARKTVLAVMITMTSKSIVDILNFNYLQISL